MVPHTGFLAEWPMHPNLGQIRRRETHETHGTVCIRVQIRAHLAAIGSRSGGQTDVSHHEKKETKPAVKKAAPATKKAAPAKKKK